MKVLPGPLLEMPTAVAAALATVPTVGVLASTTASAALAARARLEKARMMPV